MKYLQAKRIVDSVQGSKNTCTVILAASFQIEAWVIYVQAHYAKLNIIATVEILPFDTLAQFLNEPIESDKEVVTVLMPWDLHPSLDWRKGYTKESISLTKCYESITENLALVKKKSDSVFYFNTASKPIFSDSLEQNALNHWIPGQLKQLNIPLHVSNVFSLPLYFQSAQPLTGKAIGVEFEKFSQLLSEKQSPNKVIITDLDFTLWHGVIGEDGVNGIQYNAAGDGYPHFLYQTLLKRLKSQGVLLVAVSKNDFDLANVPFAQNTMTLNDSDFVSIIANYEAKSAQIKAVSKALDLPTDCMVFVDDNPVELEEVKLAIPDIQLLQFTPGSESKSDFYSELLSYFPKSTSTSEDSNRTELYRTRLKGQINVTSDGANIDEFLGSLNMQLHIQQRSISQSKRALQLINKTNQFNLNGNKLDQSELDFHINNGAKLWTATLSDKHGSHGEIIACLVQGGDVLFFVMSCRVLKRKVEHAFISQLATILCRGELNFNFQKTSRNVPFQKFMESDSAREIHRISKHELQSFQSSLHLFNCTVGKHD